MSHPGSYPGDPSQQQPWQQPEPGPHGYPPIDYGTGRQAPNGTWPPASPQVSPATPLVPPGGYPPPPAYPGYQGYPGPQGYPSPPAYPGQFPPAYGAPVPTNGMAIGSLVSSLVAIPVGVFCFLGILGSIVGIVLGVLALNQVKKTHQKGKEMAIAGIVIGGLGLLGLAVLVVVVSSHWWF